MIELVQAIPAKLRQRVYFGMIAAAFMLGAIHVALASAGVTEDPTWLKVTDDVLKYLSVPVLGVAGINVTTKSKPEPAPDWPGDELNQEIEPEPVIEEVHGRHKAELVPRPELPRRVPPGR